MLGKMATIPVFMRIYPVSLYMDIITFVITLNCSVKLDLHLMYKLRQSHH